MNKVITGIVVGAVIIVAIGFLVFKKSTPAPISPQVQQTNPEQSVKPAPSGGTLFDTNDNLDQALQDLDQVE